MLAQSFLESRSESLISGARLLLASALLLALGQSGWHASVLLPLALYLLCALLLPAVLPRLAISGLRAQAALDGLDLVAFALLSWRSAGDPRVCLPLLAFLLFASALRWRWRVVSASQGRFGRDMCRIAAWPHAPLDGDALP